MFIQADLILVDLATTCLRALVTAVCPVRPVLDVAARLCLFCLVFLHARRRAFDNASARFCSGVRTTVSPFAPFSDVATGLGFNGLVHSQASLVWMDVTVANLGGVGIALTPLLPFANGAARLGLRVLVLRQTIFVATNGSTTVGRHSIGLTLLPVAPFSHVTARLLLLSWELGQTARVVVDLTCANLEAIRVACAPLAKVSSIAARTLLNGVVVFETMSGWSDRPLATNVTVLGRASIPGREGTNLTAWTLLFALMLLTVLDFSHLACSGLETFGLAG